MKLMFEIRDLKFATPATATRAGILFISESKQWHNMVRAHVCACVCVCVRAFVSERLRIRSCL